MKSHYKSLDYEEMTLMTSIADLLGLGSYGQ